MIMTDIGTSIFAIFDCVPFKLIDVIMTEEEVNASFQTVQLGKIHRVIHLLVWLLLSLQ